MEKETKGTETKGTGEKGNHLLISAIVSLALFAVVVALAAAFRVFDGVDEVLAATFKINGEVIFKVFIVIAFMILVRNILLFVLRSIKLKSRRGNTLLSLFDSLVRYAAVIIGICWSLAVAGVNVSTIFAGVGIIALIVGFGAESLIADVVTGFFILFENQYNVGDIIEIDGFRGEVSRIGIRTICVRDTGGNEKIINNSSMKNVLNRSDYQSVAVCDIGVPYEVDLDEIPEKMTRILAEIKKANEDIFIGELKYLGVEELADSCVVLRVMAEVNERDIYSGRRLLNKEMKTRLEKEGITVPYPQVNVRHD